MQQYHIDGTRPSAEMSTTRNNRGFCKTFCMRCKGGLRCLKGKSDFKWPVFSFVMLLATIIAIVATSLTLDPFQSVIADVACGKSLMNALRGFSVLTILFCCIILIVAVSISCCYYGYHDVDPTKGLNDISRSVFESFARSVCWCLLPITLIFSMIVWCIAASNSSSSQDVFDETTNNRTLITVLNCGLPNFPNPFLALFLVNSFLLVLGFVVTIVFPENSSDHPVRF